MFAVRIEKQLGLNFWQSPDPKVIMTTEIVKWDLHEARKFIDENRTTKQPFAVYHIRGWYHKKIWPQNKEGQDASM